MAETYARKRHRAPPHSLRSRLQTLPICTGGITVVPTRTARSVHAAMVRICRAQPQPISFHRARQIEQAAIWVAFRCTPVLPTELSMIFSMADSKIHFACSKINKRILEKHAETIADVESILRLLCGSSAVPVLTAAKVSPVDPVRGFDPSLPWDQVTKLRGLKWSASGIARHTGVELALVEKFLGIERAD